MWWTTADGGRVSQGRRGGVFPFGFHGFTHSGFDVAAKDFRYILKYQLMYMSDEQAAKLAAKFARIYGTTPQESLEGYIKGKLLVKITASGSTLGPGVVGLVEHDPDAETSR